MASVAAVHEAGHAVIATLEGRKAAATINVLAPLASFTEGDGLEDALRADLRITVAGKVAEGVLDAAPAWHDDPAAEESIYPTARELEFHKKVVGLAEGQPPRPVEKSDDEIAAEIAAQLNPADPDAEIALAEELAWRTLVVHRRRLARIAERLEEWRVLTHDAILELWPDPDSTGEENNDH